MSDMLELTRSLNSHSEGNDSSPRPGGKPARQVYFQRGRIFTPIDPATLDLQTSLPPGTYTIGETSGGFHFEQVDNFELPPKLYGDFEARAQRIVDTFVDRPSGTGILLSGNKGSGKTMLAKRLSQIAIRDKRYISIVISRPLCGEAFNTFLQDIQQPAVVIFDEFEKVYDASSQAKLLTVFDGTYSSKKLFILTCNDRHRVDAHMHNRPGRIYYAIEFSGLSAAFIREYCGDNLRNKKHVNGVINVGSLFNEFSFDMLKALVEEMNRYSETATQAMRILNIKPQADSGVSYAIKIMRNEQQLLANRMYPTSLNRSPLCLFEDFRIRLIADDDEDEFRNRRRNQTKKDREPRPGYVLKNEEFSLTTADLVSYDSARGIFTFKTDQPDTYVIFTRETKPQLAAINYEAL